MANEVTRATGGRRTGVRVESPTGNVYSGSRIQTPQTVVFILVNQGTDNVVIIYAPEPSVADVAVRLAGNVGNGEGLNDYPEVRNSLWTLPPRPPEGLMLQEANTLTRGDFERSLGELESAVGDGGGAGVQQLLSRVRQFIPERLTAARYTDRRQQAWNVVVGDYQSPGRAWTIWMMLRGLLSVSGLGASSVPGGDGLYATVEDGRMMALQKGPYIVVLGGPTSAPIDRLMGLAQLFQL